MSKIDDQSSVQKSSLQYNTNAAFDELAENAFPAEVYMISACHDSEKAHDIDDVFSFGKENGAVIETSARRLSLRSSKRVMNRFSILEGRKSGGACTRAFLKIVLSAHNNGTIESMSWVTLLRSMWHNLRSEEFNQVPQLTSSRLIDVNTKLFSMSNSESYGTKRAVLIGINYIGQNIQLNGCHDDVNSMVDYLEKYQGFEQHNMTVLMDDGNHRHPSYRNIMSAYRNVARKSMPGDTVFLHFSGHGGQVKSLKGDEDDGYDEALIPADVNISGPIVDNDICDQFVKPMQKGVLVISLTDCCHSGTVFDLPYRFSADREVMGREKFTNLTNPTVDRCCC